MSFLPGPPVNAAKVTLPVLPGASSFRVPGKKVGTPCDLRPLCYLSFASTFVLVIYIPSLFPLLPCQYISKSQDERPCTGPIPTSRENLEPIIMPSHSHPRSHLHLDAFIFVSFPDPSISIPHYPRHLIHSIHPEAPLSLPPEPFTLLPTLCCHLTPIWIIWPDPKLPSITSPCTIPPISGPLAPAFGTCCFSSPTCLNMTAVFSCLPRSHKVPAPLATASCDRPCLPLEPLA